MRRRLILTATLTVLASSFAAPAQQLAGNCKGDAKLGSDWHIGGEPVIDLSAFYVGYVTCNAYSSLKMRSITGQAWIYNAHDYHTAGSAFHTTGVESCEYCNDFVVVGDPGDLLPGQPVVVTFQVTLVLNTGTFTSSPNCTLTSDSKSATCLIERHFVYPVQNEIPVPQGPESAPPRIPSFAITWIADNPPSAATTCATGEDPTNECLGPIE